MLLRYDVNRVIIKLKESCIKAPEQSKSPCKIEEKNIEILLYCYSALFISKSATLDDVDRNIYSPALVSEIKITGSGCISQVVLRNNFMAFWGGWWYYIFSVTHNIGINSFRYHIYVPGDSAQKQREPPHHTIQHVVSWNIPEHQAPPSHSVQGSGLGEEILS